MSCILSELRLNYSILPVKDGRRLHLLPFCAALIFLLFPSYCFGDPAKPTFPAGVDIKTAVQPQTATIGDRISIELNISAPEGYRIEVPEPEQQIDNFFILEFLPGPDIPDTRKPEQLQKANKDPDASSRLHKARITAAIYKTGTFTFPGIPVSITDMNGVKTEIQSPSVDVEIQSILSENDQALRDLKKQADIPGKIRWVLWMLFALAFVALSAAAWYIRRKYRKRPAQIPPIPAQNLFDLAESELRSLVARDLPEKGHTKKFYIVLSEIVKRILETAYEIQTTERTTIEITDSLHRHDGLGQENLNTIEPFLVQCDIVKFAKYIPSKSENENAVKTAFRILQQARNFGDGPR